MKMIPVQTGVPYTVRIEAGLLDQAGEILAPHCRENRRAVVITDKTVQRLHGNVLRQSLAQAGISAVEYAITPGEEHKTLCEWEKILYFLQEQEINRRDLIIAFGGGVVGDIAGFAAACYGRGMDCVQIPTTVMAMADSSVGGKTAVNLGAAKNMVGAFHQPRMVLCDPTVIRTLPHDVFAEGTAEIIKMGVISGEKLFTAMESGCWPEQAEDVLAMAIQSKVEIVCRDERDTGIRHLLNLGHTFGHAMESRSGFTLPHGRAVALGLMCAARLSKSLKLCDAGLVQKIKNVLIRYDLPVDASLVPEELIPGMLTDKKREDGNIPLILPREIGRCEIVPMPMDKMEAWIHRAMTEDV